MTRVLVTSAAYILTDYLPSSEGISCYKIFQNLENFGYTFEAVSAYVRIKKPLKNVRFHQVGSFEIYPSANLVEKYLSHGEFIIRSYLKSRSILKKKEIDIIHHMFPAVYNQSFSLIAILRKTEGKPLIFGPISTHIYPRPPDEKLLLRVTSKLHMRTIRNCNLLVTITPSIKKIYTGIVNEERVWVIPMGVDVELFKPLRRKEKSEGYEVLTVGHLYPLKGVRYLVRAMHLIAEKREDVKLRIIGEGSEKRSLMKLAVRLGIGDRVIFEGFVHHTKLPKYYQKCDIFCFPTLGEPFGKSILEAMACGKPVIASNIGGPTQILKDEETGILVPPAKPEILASKILELLDDEKRRRRLGINARRHVMEHYSWEKIAERYHELYTTLQ